MQVCSRATLAVKLYRDVERYPSSSTRNHLYTQHGLAVGGPLFTNPAEGPASLLRATQVETGRPVVVKMLDNTAAALDWQQQPGGSEGMAHRYVLCSCTT
jgi:hypothetical protein